MPSANQLIELFDEAKLRPVGAAREEFLEKTCQGNAELKFQLVSLLNAHEQAGGFLKKAVLSRESDAAEALGTRIGRYQLVECIGQGGCGVVYVAEQVEPVRRRVALKVIKLGLDTRQVVARFEAERQALALMDHPNIAKVLDAGATGTGRPYFVMELVDGLRITEFCDRSQLSTGERLELFMKVCQAIQHAHQKGVIHRDIKPSNILVALHDGVAVPKVIDFGIAKAIEGRLADLTVYTQLHHLMGTPAYMSPEQAEMSGVDVDTRSDIYSLGVLLYELLTGRTPFDPDTLLNAGLDEIRRVIREEEPHAPSRFLSGLTPDARTQIARLRKADAVHLLGQVRGDLDWIVMKALEKDRGRRYPTANGLASDVQRHLQSEPVSARPPTSLYRVQKTLRRHKFAFAAALAIAASLVAGMVLALSQARRAASEARRAASEARRAVSAEGMLRQSLYAYEVNLALRIAENDLGGARQRLERQRPAKGQDDLRGFEWRYLETRCQGDELESFYDEGARAAAFSPDGRYLVYSSRNIIVRELGTRTNSLTLPRAAMSLSFAPHTNLLASGSENAVTLWNTDTWAETSSLPDAAAPSLFSPDGHWLLTGTSGTSNGTFRLWNTKTWQPLGDCLDAPKLTFQVRNAVAFSPDGQFVVTIAGEGIGNHLRVWRLPGLEEERQLRIETEEPGSVAFSHDGKQLMVGLRRGPIAIFDFATRLEVQRLKEHTAWVTSIDVARDGQTFVTSSSDRTVCIWDARTYRHLARLRGHVGEVWCAAMSPDGARVASGSDEDHPTSRRPTTKLWSSATRHNPTTITRSGRVAGFSGPTENVVTLTSNRWCIWNPENKELVEWPIPSMPPVVGEGTPYAAKPDEPLGALGRTDGTIELWHLTTGSKVTGWLAHTDSISALAFSPQGNQLASGAIDGEVKLWKGDGWRDARRLGTIHARPYCLTFSANGETIAASSGFSSRVCLWNTLTGRSVLELETHGGAVMSVAFSPDGTVLATATLSSNEVRLWELPSGKKLQSLSGHMMGITSVAFCPDGKTLATTGFDGQVKLWHVATHQELASFTANGTLPLLKFSPLGRILTVGSMTDIYQQTDVLFAPSFEEIARH